MHSILFCLQHARSQYSISLSPNKSKQDTTFSSNGNQPRSIVTFAASSTNFKISKAASPCNPSPVEYFLQILIQSWDLSVPTITFTANLNIPAGVRW